MIGNADYPQDLFLARGAERVGVPEVDETAEVRLIERGRSTRARRWRCAIVPSRCGGGCGWRAIALGLPRQPRAWSALRPSQAICALFGQPQADASWLVGRGFVGRSSEDEREFRGQLTEFGIFRVGRGTPSGAHQQRVLVRKRRGKCGPGDLLQHLA